MINFFDIIERSYLQKVLISLLQTYKQTDNPALIAYT